MHGQRESCIPRSKSLEIILLAVGVPAVGQDDDGVLGVEVGRGQGLLSELNNLKVFWIPSENMDIDFILSI